MSAIDDVIAVQRLLIFSSDGHTILRNRQLIGQLRTALSAQLQVLDGLARTNRSLCKHEGATSYTDRGGGYGLDCRWCGGS